MGGIRLDGEENGATAVWIVLDCRGDFAVNELRKHSRAFKRLKNIF